MTDVVISGISRHRLERIPFDELQQVYKMVTSVYRLRSNTTVDSMSAKMAALAVGDSFTVEGRTRHLTTKERGAAFLRCREGRWASRTTTRGLRITRTA